MSKLRGRADGPVPDHRVVSNGDQILLLICGVTLTKSPLSRMDILNVDDSAHIFEGKRISDNTMACGFPKAHKT